MMERQRLKKRKKQKLDSDDSAGEYHITMVTVISDVIDEYCPDNQLNETSDDSCSSGVDESIVNGNHPSDSSEECMEVTPSTKKSTKLSSTTPQRPNGISKKKSLIPVTPSQLNCSANVRMVMYVCCNCIICYCIRLLYHHPLGAMLPVVMENLPMKDLSG